jgi:HAD superfamily hydrolase (TIGR01490 family)
MKKFAVFDIDGTLIRWQLYHAVVDKLAQKGLLGKEADKILHEARMVWKRREHPNAFREYEMQLINIYEQALPHLTPQQFDQAVEEVAQEYKTQVYTYTRDLIARLKKEGYMLIAISGSHREIVKHIAEQFGFDHWTGTEYERKNGQFTGKVTVGSHDKKSTLQNFIKEHELSISGSYAVGDSKSDAVMLEIVENPIAFNPDRELLEIAKKNNWKIVVERKNVVYELEDSDGSYLLA